MESTYFNAVATSDNAMNLIPWVVYSYDFVQ